MMPSYTNLSRLKQYLRRYHNKDHPAAFEYLVGSTFSQIFYLPLQSKSTEDKTKKHRVIWFGDIDRNRKAITKSPSGLDSVCLAYGFNILLECTLRIGANQWRKEFVESLKHYDRFVKDNKVPKKDVYLAIVVSKLHRDTYTGYQQKAKEGRNVVLLESTSLAKIGDVLKIMSIVRHLDLRQLLNDMIKILRDSTSFDKFRGELNESISKWQKDVLKVGKSTFIGIKSYRAMCQIRRTNISAGEIFRRLLKDRIVKEYFDIINDKLSISDIERSIIDQGLAVSVGQTVSDDQSLFEPVHKIDFRARGERLVKEVE